MVFKKGDKSWNKGLKGVQVAWNKGLKGAYILKHKGQFQKGHIPYNKGIEGLQIGEKNSNYKNGTKNDNGYLLVLSLNHPFRDSNNYVKRSRLVVEEHIERFLLKNESVHHVDEIKNNDTSTNLIAFANESAHQRFHHNPNNVKPEEIIFDGRNIFI